MRRQFRVEMIVHTHLTDDELMAAARQIYTCCHKPTPSVGWAVSNLISASRFQLPNVELEEATEIDAS